MEQWEYSWAVGLSCFQLVHLLDENFKVPQEERLDVLEFDLDTETREELLAEAEVERDKYRRLLEAECRDCDRLAEVIRQNTWDTMDVKSRCIKVSNNMYSSSVIILGFGSASWALAKKLSVIFLNLLYKQILFEILIIILSMWVVIDK